MHNNHLCAESVRDHTDIPNILFEMDLDPYEFKAYCVLKWISNNANQSSQSNADICEKIGCSRVKFLKIKKKLVDLGLIKIYPTYQHDGGRDHNLYEVKYV